jgi:[acyl-carrier-protein] S-malonyltransferase
MQRAVPEGIGAMAAILKVDAKTLNKICTTVHTSQKFGSVEIANFNSPEQLIISGHKLAVNEVIRQLKLDGKKIIAKLLPVSAPFHSSLMQAAKAEMTPILLQTKFSSIANIKFIANVDAAIHTSYHPSFLIDQIDHPVLWFQSMETALKNNAGYFVEVGPGHVLTNLAKRIAKEDRFIYESTFDLTSI